MTSKYILGRVSVTPDRLTKATLQKQSRVIPNRPLSLPIVMARRPWDTDVRVALRQGGATNRQLSRGSVRVEGKARFPSDQGFLVTSIVTDATESVGAWQIQDVISRPMTLSEQWLLRESGAAFPGVAAILRHSRAVCSIGR